jgi:hypothetical protein
MEKLIKRYRLYLNQNENLKSKASLFLGAWLQVFLVAVNTYQLAHHKLVGCFIIGFMISFVWTFNVKKVAFGTTWDRITYAFGAGVGTVTGLLASQYFYESIL